MTHTHTPGPWNLGKRAGNPAIYGKNGAEIAEILSVLTPEWRENARLISAAPEMLEVLEMLMFQEPNRHEDICSYDRACWEYAHTAIAKATGKGDA